MAMQIWKTDISVSDEQVRLPLGSIPISVHMQAGVPMMWSLVDTSQPRAMLPILVAGTGHTLPDNLGRFLGTFMVAEDALVFHVFTLRERN